MLPGESMVKNKTGQTNWKIHQSGECIMAFCVIRAVLSSQQRYSQNFESVVLRVGIRSCRALASHVSIARCMK